MKWLCCVVCIWVSLLASTCAIHTALLYDHQVPEAIQLPKEDDVSSPAIHLKVPVIFFGQRFDSIFVNSNGLVTFQTEIPIFFNVEFPLDYALIAPFYSNVDTRLSGTISYYETSNPTLLKRASQNIHNMFSNLEEFQATSLFIVTWFQVGYFNRKSDKTNIYQMVLISDGEKSFTEFLYPKDGIQWIQGTGDESGLPDARAQVGFISTQGKMFTLPGSGTEQVRNLEMWSNIDIPGQFLYRVDEETIGEPDLVEDLSEGNAITCADAPTFCHVRAKCRDYEEGFCCQCQQQYYGDGRFCVKKDVPIRVNGKVSGKINGELLDHLDLQSYIVMVDGRAYTAISNVPDSIGFDSQSLQILGSVIGYLFAKPVRNALNGYQLTGGVFNHTATLKFLNTSQTLSIKQKYIGLDVFDHLRLEATLIGDVPALPLDAKVEINEYQEQYTHTSPGVIQMSSTRSFTYEENGQDIVQYIDVEQVFVFDYCKFENGTIGETWKLKIGKNFISYEAREKIIRFGLTNKITPLGDVDPCDEGRSQCMPNSACVVDNDSFRCVCNPGYQHIYTGNETICTDIDECQSGLHGCDYNAQCINAVGTYSCQCNPGFTGNGQVCENEYSCENVACPTHSECIEHQNVARCTCSHGYTGDGQTCSAIVDLSCHVANNCHHFGMCAIDQQTNEFHCSCLPGYEGDGYNCRKTELEPEDNREIQQCLLGVCWCAEGYRLEPGTKYCLNGTEEPTIDETSTNERPEVQCYDSKCFCPKGFSLRNDSCVLEGTQIGTKGSSGFNISCSLLNNCHQNAQCLLINSEYSCQCLEGFQGNGTHCEPLSCIQTNNCSPHATCTYDAATAKSQCVCNLGYEGDGLICKAALCTSDYNCTITEQCAYSQQNQQYECVCKEGNVRDSQNQCVQPGTCGGGICVENAECLFDNDVDIDYCSCKSGFIGDGIILCKPKPIGCEVNNNCGLHATCELDPTTTLYQCKCSEGYHGDGFICYTEINCHVEPTLCHPEASCITDANRRYICQCNNGYTGNGSHCKLIPSHEGNFLLLNQGMSTLKIPFEPTRKNPGKPIQIKLYQTAVGLDIDCLEGRVYWGDISGKAIRSSSYNGSSKSDFIKTEIGSPEGVAVDWVSRNIYWTDSTKDTIEVASLEGKRRRVLFDTQLVNPRGIAVHPQRGKIFWTDWDRKSPKIEWSNADGTDRQIFVKGASGSLPNSLTIDYDTENLCYADAGTKKIECVDIDARVKRTIATNCTYPFGITVSDRHIYWSDWITKKIERVDKVTLQRLPSLQVPIGGSGNKLYGLVAVPQSCPILTNVCQYYKDQCPTDHICLPNGSGSRTCVCTTKADTPSEVPSCTL